MSAGRTPIGTDSPISDRSPPPIQSGPRRHSDPETANQGARDGSAVQLPDWLPPRPRIPRYHLHAILTLPNISSSSIDTRPDAELVRLVVALHPAPALGPARPDQLSVWGA